MDEPGFKLANVASRNIESSVDCIVEPPSVPVNTISSPSWWIYAECDTSPKKTSGWYQNVRPTGTGKES